MITTIGIVAGDIWHFLDQHSQTSLSNLVESLDRPRDMILMSLGWLAREGHVVLQESDGEFLLSLRREANRV